MANPYGQITTRANGETILATWFNTIATTLVNNGAVKNNIAGTTAPVVTDDDSNNYEPGSVWVDTTNDKYHICVDASTGAAIWIEGVDLTSAQTFENKTYTLPKINEAVNLTATSTELNQLDNVSVGGTSAGDIVTINGTQTLTAKTLTSPNINEAVALTSTATELNQLDGVSIGGTSAGDVITIDATQTMSAKTLTAPVVTNANADFGTASDAQRVILPKDTTANLAGLTNIKASLAYDTTLDTIVSNTGSGWVAPSAGITDLNLNIASQSGAFTALVSVDMYLLTVASAYTMTLPTAVGNGGKRYTVGKIDAANFAVTIDPDGSETVGGQSTISIGAQNQFVSFVSDNVNWVIDTNNPEAVMLGDGDTGMFEISSNNMEIRTGGTAAISIDSAQGVTMGGLISLAQVPITIASGAITATTSYLLVDTEGAASTDDLLTINGGSIGMVAILSASSSTRTVVVKDGGGNIRSSGDFSLDHVQDRMFLLHDGSFWVEISRSNNA